MLLQRDEDKVEEISVIGRNNKHEEVDDNKHCWSLDHSDILSTLFGSLFIAARMQKDSIMKAIIVMQKLVCIRLEYCCLGVFS